MRANAPAWAILLGVAAIGISACGSLPVLIAGSSPAATPAATTAVSPAGSATASPAVIVSGPGGTNPVDQIRPHGRLLTVADSGATVRLHVGQLITVVLASGGMMWDLPAASGDVLRRTSASGGYPTTRPALAFFRAVRRGRSSLTSVTDAACLHSTPRCEMAQRLWSVTVIVGG